MAQRFSLALHDFQNLAQEPKEKAAATLQHRYGGVAGIAKALGVDLEQGLRSDDAADLAARAEAFGENRVPVPPQRSLFLLMWDALHDVTLIILLVAGTISLVVGLAFEDDKATGWIEGAAILGAVGVVVLVSSINDYQKERQFRKLNAVKEDSKVNVLRDGLVKQVSKYDLVVGELVFLAQGDELYADGIIVEASGLTTNEAALTGESDDVKKNTTAMPFVYSGTQVMDGVGKMIVTAVGQYSEAGIIHMLITGQAKKKKSKGEGQVSAASESADMHVAQRTSGYLHKKGSEAFVADEGVVDLDAQAKNNDMMANKSYGSGVDKASAVSVPIPSVAAVDTIHADGDEDDEEEGEGGTILQQKLERLAVLIGYVGLVVGILTFLVLVIRFCIETYTERGWQKDDFTTLLDYFIIGVTVLVVAIPEGLPLAVTLALAFSMTQMIKENNLVRHLDACETMGSATTVCSDKTGTLTTNRMTVVKATVGDVETNGRPLGQGGIAENVADLVVENIVLNSTAEVQPPASGVGLSDHVGSKTECALLQLVIDMGKHYHEMRVNSVRPRMFPFSSAKKRMSVVVKTPEDSYRLHTKGASEIVLGLCTHIAMENGEVKPLTGEMRKRLLEKIEEYASDTLRTLCLAYKDVQEPEGGWDSIEGSDLLETDMTCLMVAGIEDPVRPEVPAAIKQFERAGITVRMVTGDNVTTARAIARKCGILVESRGDTVLEGPEFRTRVLDANGNIKQEEMDAIWPSLRVLARSSPTDKYTLVSGILASQQGKHSQVVAVTGDGTNDAPALKRADIGFAMGIQGTAVAKNASDIILMDDNFSSIVAALKWGRNVYDSISKFVQFQLTVNVAALVISFTSAAITQTTSLTAVQLLWVNLIMDTLAALALATERPVDSLLDRKPYGRNKALVSRRMWWFIMMHALYQITMLFLVQYGFYIWMGLENGADWPNTPTPHYTMVFNVFVLCQLFNEINARKLHGEWNVFAGIFTNPYFCVIGAVQLGTQILIIQFGGRVFMTTPLTWEQWGICFAIGAGELVWHQIINAIPNAVPETWRIRMAHPFKKSFWLKSRRRLRSNATRPFRKSMKTSNVVSNQSSKNLSMAAQHDALLRPDPRRHMSMYESALLLIMTNATSPKVRLRAAVRIVQERVRVEHSHDDIGALRSHEYWQHSGYATKGSFY